MTKSGQFARFGGVAVAVGVGFAIATSLGAGAASADSSSSTASSGRQASDAGSDTAASTSADSSSSSAGSGRQTPDDESDTSSSPLRSRTGDASSPTTSDPDSEPKQQRPGVGDPATDRQREDDDKTETVRDSDSTKRGGPTEATRADGHRSPARESAATPKTPDLVATPSSRRESTVLPGQNATAGADGDIRVAASARPGQTTAQIDAPRGLVIPVGIAPSAPSHAASVPMAVSAQAAGVSAPHSAPIDPAKPAGDGGLVTLLGGVRRELDNAETQQTSTPKPGLSSMQVAADPDDLVAPLAVPAARPTFAQVVFSLIQRTLFNRSPVVSAGPTLVGPFAGSGNVVGAVTVVDPDDDPLSYVVVKKPKFGVVTLGANGRFVYTPDAEYRTTGVTDTFVIRVRDRGLHLHLFNGTGAVRVPVSITSEPVDVGQPEFAKTFQVYNFTSSNLTYTGYATGSQWQAPSAQPDDGAVIAPGEYFSFDVPWGSYLRTTAAYFDSDLGQFQAVMRTDAIAGVYAGCYSAAGAACDWDITQNGILVPFANVILMEDKAGTVVNFGSNQQLAQSEVLNNLCATNSNNCTFDPTYSTSYYTKWVFLGEYQNATSVNQQRSFERTVTRGTKETIELSATAKASIAKIYEVSMTAKYGQEFTYSYTFKDSTNVTVPPNSTVYVYSAQPIVRQYGTFTVTMPNTTWVLTDVYFDSPTAEQGSNYRAVQQPLPPNEVDSDPT
ncbi:Ig-like domain-containing protein [Mycobacterium sp. pW049]|uniref:Ig-like domain-containing protein n=1 Tax=[Mycobacterium] bulgaricum TaxID=3238985 RepID=UPI00351B845B